MEAITSKSSTLFLFTSEFPYGKGEVFIENEVPVLCNYFQKIYIIPQLESENFEIHFLPKEVEIVNLPHSVGGRMSKICFLIQNLLFIVRFVLQEIIFSRQKKLALKNIKPNFFLLFSLLQKGQQLMPLIKANPSALFYTFWFSTDATLLSLLVKKRIIPYYVSRAHGFDLYENNGKENYLAYRHLQLSAIQKVYCVSQTGKKYLEHLYPVFKSKIAQKYLGVYDRGMSPVPTATEIILVSCSNIVKVKRVHLIVQALKSVHVKLRWIHFGSGALLPEIKEMLVDLPKNIQVEMRGTVENASILQFYKEQPVSLFVNVSISEGIPVTIMEAVSFGIPIFATDVGGVSEIVTSATGYLAAAAFQPIELSNFLNQFGSSKYIKEDFRTGVKKFWSQHYSALKNYSNFAEEIRCI